jgi:hypothetical protein
MPTCDRHRSPLVEAEEEMRAMLMGDHRRKLTGVALL